VSIKSEQLSELDSHSALLQWTSSNQTYDADIPV